jgi:membrane-associated phospholipid phosphatase
LQLSRRVNLPSATAPSPVPSAKTAAPNAAQTAATAVPGAAPSHPHTLTPTPALQVPLRAALVIALLLALAAGAVLLAGADRNAFLAVNARMSFLPVQLLAALSLIGLGLYAVLAFTPALVLAPRIFAAAVVAAPVAGLLSQAGKRAFGVPRPLAVLGEGQVHVVGQALMGHNSLPSGHSITAATCMTVLLLALQPRRRTPLVIAATVVLGALVMVARIGVGAHWPSDVLLGGAFGVIAGCIGVALVERWRFYTRSGGQWTLALIAGACAVAGLFVTTDVPPQAWLLKYVLSAVGFASVLLWLVQQRQARAGRGAVT